MSTFKEMDPEVVWRLIEGHEDVLAPALKSREDFYSQFNCPRCKCKLIKEFDPRTCFSGDGELPKALLRCPSCSYMIDPHTNLVVKFGDASKIPVESSPLILPGRVR